MSVQNLTILIENEKKETKKKNNNNNHTQTINSWLLNVTNKVIELHKFVCEWDEKKTM